MTLYRGNVTQEFISSMVKSPIKQNFREINAKGFMNDGLIFYDYEHWMKSFFFLWNHKIINVTGTVHLHIQNNDSDDDGDDGNIISISCINGKQQILYKCNVIYVANIFWIEVLLKFN